MIGSIDSTYLRVHSIQLNATSDNPVSLLTDALLFENHEASPTCFAHYTRLNKKMWIVGDSSGSISVFFQDGELQGRAAGKVGPILFIDKYGQQLMYAGKNRISVFNTGTLEAGIMCEATLHEIQGISMDIAPAIAFAALANGDILVYDTRYSVNNGPASCRPVYRLVGKGPGQIASIKGHLLLWGQGVLTAFNTSFLEADTNSLPQYYSLPLSDSLFIKSYKNNNLNSVFIASSQGVGIYEVALPVVIAPSSTAGFAGIDMGYLRIVVIVVVVIFVVVWKSKGRKTKRDLEVERLEESLQELQKSMENTSKISEDLTKRFKSVEETTKHLSGLNLPHGSDSD